MYQIQHRATEYGMDEGESPDEDCHGMVSTTVSQDEIINNLRALWDGTPRTIFHDRCRYPMIDDQYPSHQ